MKLHDTAVIHPGAELAPTVEIGPYSIIGENVSIDDGTVIGPHVVVDGWTRIGKNNRIFASAVIGSEPQDLKFRGEKSFVEIGDNNTIREFVTINRGTAAGAGRTIIGNNNLLMAYTHIAHDCIVGNNIIFSNAATLGGHVTIEDKVVISGLAAIHHFVTVGTVAIVGGCSKVVNDIPPFLMADGHPARVYGINVVGLRRNNYSSDVRNPLRRVYRIVYLSGLSIPKALGKVEEEVEQIPEVVKLVESIRDSYNGYKGRAKESRRKVQKGNG